MYSIKFLTESPVPYFGFSKFCLLLGSLYAKFQLCLSRQGKVRSERTIIMGIRFGANSCASPGQRGIVATSLVAWGSLCNYHYPQADTHPAYHILWQ